VSSPSGGVTIVVPCYNEELRLDVSAFGDLADTGRVSILFVDDGSTDGTAGAIRAMAEGHQGVDALVLPANGGKAEAVRAGMNAAIDRGPGVVGYCDADLATPPDELLRLVDTLMEDEQLSAVFGSRVARLGTSIERSSFRHYLGRVFASVASWSLGVTVYDTQCGAKVFRVTPELRAALVEPFPSTWGFDVRLLGRMLTGTDTVPGIDPEAFLEVPLREWRDVEGSKVAVGGAARALVDVVRLRFERPRRR
jgi:glycosyltransferase involved in cell wall biosynthesis